MRTLSVVLFCAAFISVAAKPTGQKESTHIQIQTTGSNNGIVGVASVAGITSRNGRVSSLGGIKFYPGYGDFKYPLTVSAERDGRYATGSVQVYPEVISTSARSGYAPNPNDLQKPFRDFFLLPPPELFASTNLDNFLPDNFFNFPQPRSKVLRSGWLYPELNPFLNFWR